MTAAVIDLGTNTFHLIIVELSAGDPRTLFKTNLPVKLGEGKINENIIIPEAFERGIIALKGFKKEIIKHNVEVVKAIATSAIRSAKNGLDFVNAAKAQAGIDITVINGDQEADYIYQGVNATGLIDNTSLIVDIGGGSIEFIICNPGEILWKKSYDIGAARLQQAYFKSDPISRKDQESIRLRLRTELSDLRLICDCHKPLHLIGSAGAFESFATMINDDVDIKQLKASTISISSYFQLSEKLIMSTHSERTDFKGLIKLRVDMIVIASLITNYVMEMINPEKFSVSTYDLKMGVLPTLIKHLKEPDKAFQ
ncbi:MAG: exopolyphosphatase [Pedobacter sp.]|nr:exopolyphosphatase [Pedobacter sp.]